MKTTIIIYRSKSEWRWRMKRSGRIVADSGEGYKSKATIMRALARLILSFVDGEYEYKDAD